jgi:hypothetical protein
MSQLSRVLPMATYTPMAAATLLEPFTDTTPTTDIAAMRPSVMGWKLTF